MTRLLIIEIDKCEDCPNCKFHKTYCESEGINLSNFMVIPDWCPLPDKEASK